MNEKLMTNGDSLLLSMGYHLVGETKHESLYKNEEYGCVIHLHFDKKRREIDYYILEPAYNFTALPISDKMLEAMEIKSKEYGWTV